MSSLFDTAVSWLSKALGLETLKAFPSGHVHFRTSWNPSYFDIPYGTRPDEIEQRICNAIGNTPTIFAHIHNPTPRMQRALLAVVAERVRRNDRSAIDLIGLLIAAYASPHVQDAVPGLRAAIATAVYQEGGDPARGVLLFLANMQAPFDVIDEAR
ncbi:hypothetical protein BH11PSE11_BH11PSE11_27040 [soil metagenome]